MSPTLQAHTSQIYGIIEELESGEGDNVFMANIC